MDVSRRLFIKNGGVALASIGLAPVLGPAFLRRAVFGAEPAAGGRKKTLICIFQRGAADGLSVVVPHGDPNLYRLRPNIAVAQPSKGRPDAALDLDGFYGLHPSLAPFLPIFKAGILPPSTPADRPTAPGRHFDAQDYMEAGAPGNKTIADGWLNRTVLACPEDRAKMAISPFRAVSIGGDHGLPRSLQGDSGALAIPDLKTFGIGMGGNQARNNRGKRPQPRRGDAGMAAAPAMTAPPSAASGFEALYDGAVGDVLHGPGKESFEAINMLKKANPGNYVPASGVQYPAGKFGQSLQQIAQLVKADVGMEVAFAEWAAGTPTPTRAGSSPSVCASSGRGSRPCTTTWATA